MESKQIDINEIQERLAAIESALESRGIIISRENSDEGEMIGAIKKELEKRRKSKNYVSHEEVKKIILAKK